jgi:serine/threonine protein kinase/tetratricopeptide (TPR) repeat protein
VTEQDLFVEAVQISDPAARDAYLDRACADDAGLRRRVAGLLGALGRAGGFLEAPLAVTADAGAPRDYRPEASVETAGDVVGPYKLLEQIGEGGFGVVFMAEQTQPVRRRVALKVLKPGMDTRQVVARFEAERQALAIMDHPNIAKVHDAGATETGRPYFVMELVRGVPVTAFCDQNHLSVRDRLLLFMPVCHAIQHAHQKGVIHRDIKPNNVLVTLHDGVPVPKVIDFGIAKATGQPLTERTLFTNFAQMVGTPLYMSPEQAEMSGLDVDTRTDIYALGVLLYELLTGTTPLDKDELRQGGLAEVLRRIREQEPPKPSTRLNSSPGLLATAAAHRKTDSQKLPRAVRGELDWIVMKALDKDRNRRFATANSLARDVHRYLADEVVEARPPSAGYRLKKFVRRNKGHVVAAGLVLTVLIAGIGGTVMGLVRALKAEAQAKRDRDDAIAAQEAETAARDREATERRRADEEATVANAISEFFRDNLLRQTDTLHQAVGRETPMSNITVREALDRTASKIGMKFTDRPLVEAAIRLTLADTYLGMGESVLALPHARRAVDLLVTHQASDPLDLLRAKCTLGFLLLYGPEVTEAESLFQDTIGAWEPRLGANHHDVVRAKFGLAIAYAHQGKHARAVPLFEEVISKTKLIHGPDSPLLLPPMAELAVSYFEAAQDDRAEAVWTEMLATTAVRDWAKLPHTRAAKFYLGVLSLRRGKYESAERHFEEVLTATATAHGADHYYTLSCVAQLASVRLKQRRWAEAEALLTDDRKRCEAKHPDAWVIFATKALLGEALLGQKRLTETEPLLLSGYEGMKRRDAQMPAFAKSRIPEAIDQLILFYQAAHKPDEAAKWQTERAKYPPPATPLPPEPKR